jgi:hypothetical protein
MPRRRSSFSKALRPPRPPENRVVKTIPLSVRVEAGAPWAVTAARNVASTIGPVTRAQAVTDRACREWSPVQARISASVPSASAQWVKSDCRHSLGWSAWNLM